MKTHARSTEAGSRTFAVNATVEIPIGPLRLAGDLQIPQNAAGLVLFAHGSGSNRNSPHNQSVAHALRRSGFGTLHFDLLTQGGEALWLNEDAYAQLRCRKMLEEFARLAADWFPQHFGAQR